MRALMTGVIQVFCSIVRTLESTLPEYARTLTTTFGTLSSWQVWNWLKETTHYKCHIKHKAG